MVPSFIKAITLAVESKMLKKNNLFDDQINQEAWVVFSGETDLPWLKILKKGYRHCFVLINDGQRWFSIDPLSAYTEVQVYHHILPSFDLPSWLQSRGYQIIKTSIERQHKRSAPIMVFSCVEVIKRVLGIHKRFIFTPWQLYQFLQQASEIKTLPINQKEISYG